MCSASRPKQSLPAQEMKPSEKRESSDSLADRRGKMDGQGMQGKTGVEMDNEKREEPLEKREESLEKREWSLEKRQDPPEKREELPEKRDGSLEKRDELREKREESRERRREARERREESRERRGKPEEAHGKLWERKATDVASPERRRRREDSESRLFGACDDNQDPQDRTPGMELAPLQSHYP